MPTIVSFVNDWEPPTAQHTEAHQHVCSTEHHGGVRRLVGWGRRAVTEQCATRRPPPQPELESRSQPRLCRSVGSHRTFRTSTIGWMRCRSPGRRGAAAPTEGSERARFPCITRAGRAVRDSPKNTLISRLHASKTPLVKPAESNFLTWLPSVATGLARTRSSHLRSTSSENVTSWQVWKGGCSTNDFGNLSWKADPNPGAYHFHMPVRIHLPVTDYILRRLTSTFAATWRPFILAPLLLLVARNR